MLKLPRKRRIRWLLAGGVLLGLVVVLQAFEDRETGANRSGPAVSSSSGIKAGGREIAPDPGKSAEILPATAAVAEAESYLSADTTDPALATGDAAAETVNVGEYIDPEGIVTDADADADDPAVLVGEYLDPDAEITGG